MPREEIPARVDEALDAMGIADLRDRTIDSLSGGQKQKVAVASVLALHWCSCWTSPPPSWIRPRR